MSGAYFHQKKPIKQICRELKLSRKVVRKVIRSGKTEFTYERSVQPMPKLGRWREDLDRLLEENARQSKRERLTVVRIFEELRGLGYEGGYDAVRRYASAWRRREHESVATAFVPLIFDPGEAYQFDWSHEIVVIDGATTTVKVAHMRLCHSRMLFVRAYPRESQEMVFDAHDPLPGRRCVASPRGGRSPSSKVPAHEGSTTVRHGSRQAILGYEPPCR